MAAIYATPKTGVVITGGASGIGLATARALAEIGRAVALWDINGDKAASEAKAIADEFGVKAIGVRTDLADPQAPGPAAIKTREAIGAIGGLLYAAGNVEATGIEGVNPDNWDRGLNIHLRGLVLTTQALLPDFKANRGSAIVAIASIQGTLGNGSIPIYTAAKGGILSLIRSMADDLANYGVRANSISPGFIETPMLLGSIPEQIQDAMKEMWVKRVLLRRLGKPEEIANVARFLLSDEASFITAQEIVVDGGNITSQRV